jgi:predicted HTH transcriptional regulator
MISLQEFYQLLQSNETVEIEFKTARGGLPGNLWDTYSSFANTQGGMIVLGVKEKNKQFFLEGLTHEDILDRKKKLFDCLNNRQKVSANVLRESDVEDLETDGGWVLMINVPRADFRQRPIFINNNPDSVYKREHEGDYLCGTDEVRRMYAEANITESPQDSRILDGFSFEEDIDHPSFQEYKRLFANLQPTHPWASLDGVALLEKLGGYRRDRRSKKEGLTLAGMLMFGKVSSIQDVDCCPAYFPDYREYMSQDPNDRWTNRIYPDGRWEANLFQFFRRVYNRMLESLPNPFVLKDNVRVDESAMHIALREAFVNALIHCDYTMNASIVVCNYRSKFIFSNPGSMLVSLNQYFRGGDSVCRNKALQLMFMEIGTAEKAGSGADKIWRGWKQGNFRNPSIEISDSKIELEMPLVNILSDDVKSELIEHFGKKVSSLSHDKLLVLAACVNDGYVTNFKLQFVLDIHPSDITMLLKELCEDGYLSASGIGKGTKYVLKDTGNALMSPNVEGEKVIDRDENKAFNSNVTSKVSENVASKVSENVASKVSESEKKSKKIQNLYMSICDVCSDEFMSLMDIAPKVGRSLRYLKNNVIPEMVNNGLLVRKYPDVPSHPDQKYKKSAGRI